MSSASASAEASWVRMARKSGWPLSFRMLKREGDVLRRQPRAVVEARLGAQQEAVGQLVVRDAHAPRDEAVERIRLVAGCRAIRLSKVSAHAGGAVALQHVDVEGVEGVEVLVADGLLDLDREGAALRRLRIDVVEMLEVGRVFQVAEAGEAVAFGFCLPGRSHARQSGRGQRPPLRPAGSGDGSGVVIAALRSWRPWPDRTTRRSGTRPPP